ncbi:MAG: hypothetical protein II834_06210 [Bacteroidaceae bacterium]|nr:hypothetical protein [Bacteroidaceae bacterium]
MANKYSIFLQMIVLIDMLNTTKRLGMVSKINRGDCIRRFIGLYMVLALVLAFVIPVRMAARDSYPVQMLSPYSLNLSDYGNGSAERSDAIDKGKGALSIGVVKPQFDRAAIEALNVGNAFIQNLPHWLAEEGISMERFVELVPKRRAEDLTNLKLTEMNKEEFDLITRIRNHIPVSDITERTVMQKVIPKNAFENYTKTGGWDARVGGFMSRACDLMHLRTVEDYCYGLALNYSGSPYFNEELTKVIVDEIYVMRYTLDNGAIRKLRIPNTADDLENNPEPFKGHGYTGGGINPEGKYILGGPEFVPEKGGFFEMTAAEIYRIDKNGNETLVGVLVAETNDAGETINVFKKVVK